MNLKFFYCLVTMSVTNQNISNLIALLVFVFIDKKNFIIEIFKHQLDHIEFLPKK